MKTGHVIVFCLLLLNATCISAQTVIVTDDNAYTTGQASAVLDVKSTSKGFLAPRMTAAQRIAVASPAEGLLVYQTDGIRGFYFYTSSAWTMLTTGASSQWISTGNNIYYNTGNVGIGVTNPTVPLVVKDTMEIRRVGAMSEILFSNTGGTGDLRIAGDGGDIFWQGGGGRNLQMGAYWGIVLSGDRQTGTFPAFAAGVANTNVLALAQRDASVPLAVQGNSLSQTANLMEWRSSAATLSVVDKDGHFGIGVTDPASKLHVSGTNPLTLNGVQVGTVSDSILTIASGIVRKLAFASVASGTTWSTTGNAGTASATNFIGTTDYKSFKIRTNNIQGFLLDSLGSVGIGAAPVFTVGANREEFLVDMGNTSSVNAIAGKGSIDSYLQLNIQNRSAGTSASSDVVATANNGSETTNYVDMGINGGNYSGGVMGAANDSYLYNVGQNFLIATATPAKSLVLMTGGTNQASNERMRIDGSGNVGIGNPSPAQKLDITGNLRLSGAFMPAGDAGSVNEFLVSGGTGAAPSWLDATPFVSTIAWAKAGNAGTTSVTDFIGTTDYKSFKIRTNNIQGFLLDSLGSVGIGATPVFTAGANREELLVDMGTTSSVNAIAGKGSIDSYLQLNIQNRSAGTSASSDVVATANNGSETTNYVDMGINGGNYSGGVMGTANDSYLYNVGQNFLIATGTANKSLVFMTGGTTQASNERMRIDGNGDVGIGTNNPTALLHLKAGTAAATTAPLKFTSGTNMTTAENGAVEYDGTNYFATSGGVRYTLAKTLTATATLNFPSTGAGSASTLTVTLTGAADGDIVQLGVPNAVTSATNTFTAYVSSANTITVRFNNNAGFLSSDPASATFRVSIIKY